MRQDTVNLLLVAIFITFYCLSGNSNTQYEEVYRIQLSDDFDMTGSSNTFSHQTKAILFDINGDGNQEIIHVTSKMTLRIYSIQKYSTSIYSSIPQIGYTETSLLANSQLRSLNKVIAMKATRIHVNSQEKGIIALLSNNGIISCYDESTRLLWKVSIYENSLINLSNVVITNSALQFYNQDTNGKQHVLYAVISYSIGRRHLLKALNERLTSEEIKILKENKISVGNDIDLSKYQNSPYYYILDKYKSVYDRIISINDIKVLLINSINGDILWKTSIPPSMKKNKLFPIHQNVLNEFDYENKIPDNSDYSHSIVQFFPHSFTSYEDTQISIHSYQRNRFKPRTNYLESPLRSFLPLQFVSLLKQNIHHHHQLIQNTIELSTNEDYKNVLVLHTNVGLFILDRYNGRSFFTIHHSLIDLLSDIPLSMQKQYISNQDHLDDVISIFLSSQPFTGDNNQMISYSKCLLQAVANNQVLFSTNICDTTRKNINDEFDEILVLPPLLLTKPHSKQVNQIIVLTNDGLMVSVNMQGDIEWKVATQITWNELDESSHTIPLLGCIDNVIYIASSEMIQFYTKQGKKTQRIAVNEILQYPIQQGNDKTFLFQSLSSIAVYRHLSITYTSFIRIVLIIIGILLLIYSVISRQLNNQFKEKLMYFCLFNKQSPIK